MMNDHDAAPQDTETSLFGGGRWKVDAAGSEAEFAAKTFWGLLTVRGHFDDLDGWLDVGPAAGQTHGELTIKAAALDTGNAKRDKHLRSADFFDVENHPAVTFKATQVSDVGGGRAEISGDLEVAGKTTPLKLDAKVSADGSGLLIDSVATVDRTVFGMTWSPLGMVKKTAELHVKARLDRA